MDNDAGSTEVLPLGLLEAGDPRFVAALRGVADSAALAGFAADWFADRRPASRRLLFAYLDEPPNAPGHEGLIKRLFKRAEAAHDDEVMARFLVLSDRLIARDRAIKDRFGLRSCATLEAAQAQGHEWIAQGWGDVRWGQDPLPQPGETQQYYARGCYQTTTGSPRKTTLPRPDGKEADALAGLTKQERARRRWFSVATRRYLQRRAWRYFRTLGRTDPARYLVAAATALSLYRDAELGDGFALLDHHSLMHLLFDHSPVLRFGSLGCDLVPGRTFAGLAPSPAFHEVWVNHPEAVARVLTEARAAVVARWAVRWIEADRERFSQVGTVTGWVDLLDRPDPAVVGLALAMLDGLGMERVRAEVPPERWVRVVEEATPGNQAMVGDFVGRLIRGDEVSRTDAVRLALRCDEALARLGWGWIEERGVATARVGDDSDRDARELLRLVDAGFPPLRPRILATIRAGLAGRAEVRADWVWAMLDSRHADARAEGWAWFVSDQAFRADPTLWAWLVESPYLDIRAACAAVTGPIPIDASRLEPVWAAVLLRPEGVARIKPGVIRRVVARLDAIPPGTEADAEVGSLLDLLAAVVRSARVPERQAALAALVALAERRPEWSGRMEGAVPTLQLAAGPEILPV